MKKKLWATLVAFIALMVFATSAFAAARWRNVASISPSISAGDNNYTYHCCKVITNKPKKIAPGCPAKSVRRKSQESDMRVRFYQRPCLSGSGSPGLTPLRGLL